MKSKYFFIIIFFSFLLNSSSSLLFSADAPSIDIGAYIDTYYASDNDNIQEPLSSGRQFSYLNPKKDQFSLNIAQISANIKYGDNVRSYIAFHTGDLAKTAWESLGVANPILQQANVGFRLIDNIWLDGGYFFTHIGGECPLPKDNWLSTHSLVTYYEPFYQSGLRASYETGKFTAQLHLLNGNGIFEDNNFNKSFGWFFGYTPSELFSVSYAGIAGNEEPGSPEYAKTHILHNLVGQYNPFKDLSLKAQIDLATKDVPDEEKPGDTKSGKSLGFSLTGHYIFVKDFSGTLRFAYLDNSDSVYSPITKGTDVSLGAEYKPNENSYIRIEGRMLQFDDKYKLFSDGKSPQSSRMEIILNMGIWFN